MREPAPESHDWANEAWEYEGTFDYMVIILLKVTYLWNNGEISI